MADKYGRYTIIHEVEKSNGMRRALCRCDCGTERIVFVKNLKSGNSTSCGCRSAEVTASKNFKHGQSKTPTWRIWSGMIQRCSSAATGKNREWYFGRGIRVCERWMDYLNFLADMGDRPDGMQIDRKNNNEGYSQENCRWATPLENGRNTRHNTILTFDGESYPISVWSERKGWPRHVICNRLQYGWPVDRILTEPVHKSNRSTANPSHPANPDVGVNAGIEGGIK